MCLCGDEDWSGSSGGGVARLCEGRGRFGYGIMTLLYRVTVILDFRSKTWSIYYLSFEDMGIKLLLDVALTHCFLKCFGFKGHTFPYIAFTDLMLSCSIRPTFEYTSIQVTHERKPQAHHHICASLFILKCSFIP